MSDRKEIKGFVFICSPYRPQDKNPMFLEYEQELKQNIEIAKKACQMAHREGYLPMAPHLYFTQFLEDRCQRQRDAGIMLGLACLEKCGEVWVFGDRITPGMAMEIAKANEMEIPIKIKRFEEEETL